VPVGHICHRLAKYVHMERFAPRETPDDLASRLCPRQCRTKPLSLHCRRFAKYVRSERFAPRATPDDLASPVYLVLLNATKAAAAANAAASSAAAAPAAAAAAAGSSAVAAGSSAAAALQRSISGAFDAPGAALPVVALPPPPLEPSIETVRLYLSNDNQSASETVNWRCRRWSPSSRRCV